MDISTQQAMDYTYINSDKLWHPHCQPDGRERREFTIATSKLTLEYLASAVGRSGPRKFCY